MQARAARQAFPSPLSTGVAASGTHLGVDRGLAAGQQVHDALSETGSGVRVRVDRAAQQQEARAAEQLQAAQYLLLLVGEDRARGGHACCAEFATHSSGKEIGKHGQRVPGLFRAAGLPSKSSMRSRPCWLKACSSATQAGSAGACTGKKSLLTNALHTSRRRYLPSPRERTEAVPAGISTALPSQRLPCTSAVLEPRRVARKAGQKLHNQLAVARAQEPARQQRELKPAVTSGYTFSSKRPGARGGRRTRATGGRARRAGAPRW